MPLQATSGAASYDGFGGGVAAVPQYIEEVFQTWLWNGNNSTQTITNSIDLSTKGGLVWIKGRDTAGLGASQRHSLYDTNRGAIKRLISNNTDAQADEATGLTAFNTTGFSIGSDAETNQTGYDYVGWTFRKQPKFFDVVTYTGNGVDDRQIAHSLGSKPGCVIIKRTDTTGDWVVSHNYDFGNVLFLNTTAAAIANPASNGYFGYPADPLESTYFTLGTNAATNANGGTYVAYIFAHNAGGFGLTGTDNVISCGSYTGTGSTLSITLGYEPQWVMIKRTDTTADWQIIDNMRGWTADGVCQRLVPNTSAAEAGPTGSTFLFPTATGFGSAGSSAIVNASGGTYIYIAIRRGPMKVPTSGTSVFTPFATRNASNGTASQSLFTTNYPIDWMLQKNKAGSISIGVDRLRGTSPYLSTDSTAAETANTFFKMDSMIGVYPSSTATASSDLCSWIFRRAPSFFDEVCYTGNDTAGRTVTHNLGAVPELMIFKSRNNASNWPTYHSALGNSSGVFLNLTNASASNSDWNNTTPTASVFTLGSGARTNASGWTYVAYLFATCAGVSKVGSYTGNGTTQTINCGFGAGGARFVLIKRTDSTGDWYVYDTARGMTVLTDPYLRLNSTAAESATLGSVTTVSTGFALNSTILAAINVSSGSYIFLAIA